MWSENWSTTAAARNAVARLTPNQIARRAALLATRREHIVFFVKTGSTHQRVFCFVAYFVNDIVDGNSAQYAVVFVDDGSRKQVTMLEFPDDL